METGADFNSSLQSADGQSAPAPTRKRRKRKSKKHLVLAGLCIPVLAMMIMVLVRKPTYPEPVKRKPRPPIPAVIPPVGDANRNVAVVDPTTRPQPNPNRNSDPATGGQYQLADDAQILWAPPHKANTPSAPLDLLPPGPAVIISARLNQLLQDPTGDEVINALSPELSNLITQAANRARVDVKSIDRCSVALHPGKNGWPQVSLAIELLEPRTVKELTDKWEASKGKTKDGATVYAGDDLDSDAFYLGDSQKGAMAGDSKVKRFAIGSLDMIKRVAEVEGSAVALSPALGKLWNQSSVESDFVALVTPNFLFADGRAMLESVAPQLIEPLKSVMIPDFRAVLFSAKVADGNVYTQFSATPNGVVTVGVLKGKLKSAIESWPTWAEEFIVDSSPDRSWRLLAFRLPQMMRFFVQHTRFGQSGNIAIANNYMPANAASQISVATLLAMNTQPGQETVAMASAAKPLTLEQILDRKMTISFEAEDLNMAVKAVLDEFQSSLPSNTQMPPLRIVGSDLEAKGITQNQTVRDFNKRDLPFRTVLTDLLVGANPDKTAAGPDDPKQALVWVVADKPGSPGVKEILITTRVAADSLYELPAEFVVKQ